MSQGMGLKEAAAAVGWTPERLDRALWRKIGGVSKLDFVEAACGQARRTRNP